MTKQGRAQVIGIVQIAAGLLAVVTAGAVFDYFTPHIAPTQHSRHRTSHPAPTPTTVPATPTKISKSDLIIQQNVNCWYPVPGFVCGTERTYL